MKYLRKFSAHTDYETYITGNSKVLPNVSYCVDENDVHYNPYVPMNVITYYASAKLAETASANTSGLHTNAFNTTIVSHDFADGVGTIEFADDVTSVGNKAFLSSTTMTDINW